ncbi:MAG TPA: enolase C-terminal domain-like protein [Bryobacteraceae bacterium]|nr:enolase C-terminal domain-like protein [Bryobacteraceae bacterium]
MHRRNFLTCAAAAAVRPGLAFQNPEPRGKLPIAGVEVVKLEGHRETVVGADHQFQVNPEDIYDDLRRKPYHDSPNPTRRMAPISSLYLKIKTAPGLEGLYGPIDPEPAGIVRDEMGPFLMRKDALAGETLWDQMYRSNRHSRAGYFLMAISAVDNTLWDIRGRYYNAPVYRLLGGPSRQSVECYASCLGYSLEPDSVRKRALAFKEEGYRYQKWFLAHGPGDGPEGLRQNIELVRLLREAVGDDVELMFDAYSGWDLTYALEWARQVEKYHPHWIEEAVHPEKVESFATLRRSISFPVASGEHFYGRWEVARYLNDEAINIVQADPEWCGGISELVKIIDIASVHDAQVIPHGHSLHAALNVVASQSPMTCPLAEYLVLKMQSYYHFEKDAPRPVRAHFTLPDRPGFGIELDASKIEKQSRF